MKRIYILMIFWLLAGWKDADAQRRKVVKRKGVQRTTVKPAPVPAPAPNPQSLLLCYTLYGMPSWYLSVVNNFRFPVDMMQPSQYRLVSIHEEQFKAYLASIPYDNSNKKILLPVYSGETVSCKEYNIIRVETMDSALQARYPQIMSFKAFDQYNPLNTARIDCDGSSVRIMITHNGENYFVTPVAFNRRNYYVCYAQNDPNFVKMPFE